MSLRVLRTRSRTTCFGGSGVTSPNTETQSSASSDLMPDSQATRAVGVCVNDQSRTASEIWSQILSGCPSVTDSDENNRLGAVMKVSDIVALPLPSGALFPGRHVLRLFGRERIDVDAHRFQLQPCDL